MAELTVRMWSKGEKCIAGMLQYSVGQRGFGKNARQLYEVPYGLVEEAKSKGALLGDGFEQEPSVKEL